MRRIVRVSRNTNLMKVRSCTRSLKQKHFGICTATKLGIPIFVSVCARACVCVREGEREGGRGRFEVEEIVEATSYGRVDNGRQLNRGNNIQVKNYWWLGERQLHVNIDKF